MIVVAKLKAKKGAEEEMDKILREAVKNVESEEGTMQVRAGEAVSTRAGEWVQYSTPGEEGAEYIAVCLPAFSPDIVHRDEAI